MNPRDILQELASIELTGRDWRWHKVLRQWLQKDTPSSHSTLHSAGGSSLPLLDLAQGTPVGAQPQRISERSERGVYIFFDASNWRRERREFVLDYGELDHRHAGGYGTSSAPGMGGASAMGAASQTIPNGIPAAPGLGGAPTQAPQAPTPAPGLPTPQQQQQQGTNPNTQVQASA